MTTLPQTLLATPVDTARVWAQALVPHEDDWVAIFQAYAYPNPNPTEWVALKLRAGTSQRFTDNPYKPGARGRYCGTGQNINNQMRAPNDRIFFSTIDCGAFCWDPATKSIIDMGRVPGSQDASLYTIKFNADGTMIAGGSLGQYTPKHPTYKPALVTIDPNTLNMKFIARVGSDHHHENAYLYRIRLDGDWAVGCVGEDRWDAFTTNITTGENKVLITVSGAKPWMEIEDRDEGLTIKAYENFGAPDEIMTQFWVVDGEVYPFLPGYVAAELPFPPRNVRPYSKPLINPPQVDFSLCPDQFRWREFGSTGAWTAIDVSIQYNAAVPIQSVNVLPGGDVLTSVEQYQGWARHNRATGDDSWFGPYPDVTEGSARLLANGKLYASGYPNAPLVEYDPAKAWLQVTPKANNNPRLLGHFSDGVSLSGVKRGETLKHSPTKNRIYMAGLRDRNGVGAGVGYYDLATKKFFGTSDGMSFFVGDLGLAVFDSLGTIIFGGLIGDDPTQPGQTPPEAQLVILDQSLKTLERQQVVSGLKSTGELFKTSEPDVIVGLSKSDALLYRWNFVKRKLLGSVDLTPYGKIGARTQDQASGTIAIVLGSTLAQIDPITLSITVLGALANPAISCLDRAGSDFFVAIGGELSVIHTLIGA